MKLDEAIEKLENRGYLVEAMSPELKKVRKANRELANVETISDLITVLQKLNQAIPNAKLMMDDHEFNFVESTDGEPLIRIKKQERGDWRWANYR